MSDITSIHTMLYCTVHYIQYSTVHNINKCQIYKTSTKQNTNMNKWTYIFFFILSRKVVLSNFPIGDFSSVNGFMPVDGLWSRLFIPVNGFYISRLMPVNGVWSRLFKPVNVQEVEWTFYNLQQATVCWVNTVYYE